MTMANLPPPPPSPTKKLAISARFFCKSCDKVVFILPSDLASKGFTESKKLDSAKRPVLKVKCISCGHGHGIPLNIVRKALKESESRIVGWASLEIMRVAKRWKGKCVVGIHTSLSSWKDFHTVITPLLIKYPDYNFRSTKSRSPGK